MGLQLTAAQKLTLTMGAAARRLRRRLFDGTTTNGGAETNLDYGSGGTPPAAGFCLDFRTKFAVGYLLFPG